MDTAGHILVTGGAGYVGTHVIVELINAGLRPIILDKNETAINASVKRIFEITGHTVLWYAVDLLDQQKLNEVFKQHKIWYVLHLAGLKAVRESHSIPLDYYRVNLVGSINLFQVMLENGVFNIIFSSSSKVYGEPQYLPLDEKHPTGNCTNPYGRTKYMVEQILQDLVLSDKRWNVIVLRYFNPCGAHSSGKLGESRDSPPKNLMPCVCHAALGRLDKLTIFGQDYDTPDGTALKSYTDVVDVAKGHIAAMTSPGLNGCKYRVYNLGSPGTHSILEMVRAFEKISGRKIKIEYCGRKPGEIGECSVDSTKAHRELGWRADTTLEQMCEGMWKWITNEKH